MNNKLCIPRAGLLFIAVEFSLVFFALSIAGIPLSDRILFILAFGLGSFSMWVATGLGDLMDFNTQQTQALHDQLRTHLGPVVCAALEDETVTDIKCSDGQIWLVKHGVGDVKTDGFLSEDARRLALNLMARLIDKKINEDAASLAGVLPLTGDRVQGFVPPIAPPSFYIRCHAPEVFSWLDYINKGIMEPWHVDVIRAHIHKRSNIVFSGATGAAKPHY